MKTLTRNILLVAAICLVALLSACGSHTDMEPVLQRAETAVDTDQFPAAQAAADSVNATLDDLTPSQLCRLAVVYKKLSNAVRENEDANVGHAIECYKRALGASADSVAAFRSNMPVQDRPVFQEVVSIKESYEIDRTNMPDEHEALSSAHDADTPTDHGN